MEIVKFLSQEKQLKCGMHPTNYLNQSMWQLQRGHMWGREISLNNSHIYAFQDGTSRKFYEAFLCVASE